LSRIENYLDNFDNLFFLIWTFSRRYNKLNNLLSIFNNIPYFHLLGVPPQNLTGIQSTLSLLF